MLHVPLQDIRRSRSPTRISAGLGLYYTYYKRSVHIFSRGRAPVEEGDAGLDRGQGEGAVHRHLQRDRRGRTDGGGYGRAEREREGERERGREGEGERERA